MRNRVNVSFCVLSFKLRDAPKLDKSLFRLQSSFTSTDLSEKIGFILFLSSIAHPSFVHWLGSTTRIFKSSRLPTSSIGSGISGFNEKFTSFERNQFEHEQFLRQTVPEFARTIDNTFSIVEHRFAELLFINCS